MWNSGLFVDAQKGLPDAPFEIHQCDANMRIAGIRRLLLMMCNIDAIRCNAHNRIVEVILTVCYFSEFRTINFVFSKWLIVKFSCFRHFTVWFGCKYSRMLEYINQRDKEVNGWAQQRIRCVYTETETETNTKHMHISGLEGIRQSLKSTLVPTIAAVVATTTVTGTTITTITVITMVTWVNVQNMFQWVVFSLPLSFSMV